MRGLINIYYHIIQYIRQAMNKTGNSEILMVNLSKVTIGVSVRSNGTVSRLVNGNQEKASKTGE